MVLISPPRWEQIPLRTVAELEQLAIPGDREPPCPVLVTGEIATPRGAPLSLPKDLPLPAGAPPIDRVAVAVISVEEMPLLSRPIRDLHELVRDFPLRGPGGAAALIRFDDERRDTLTLQLGQPFLQGTAGRREVYLRTLSAGERVIVGGYLHHEIGASGRGAAYRDAPLLPVIVAETLYDDAAWTDLQSWQALPWHRKLSLLLRNR